MTARPSDDAAAREHVRFAVRTTGNLNLAPRSFLIDYDGRRLAVRGGLGGIIWLSNTPDGDSWVADTSSGRLRVVRPGDLFPKSADAADEARAMINISEATNFVGDWSNDPLIVEERSAGDFLLADDHGGSTHARVDQETGFVLELNRTVGGIPYFSIHATRIPIQGSDGSLAFTETAIPWEDPFPST